MLAAIVEVSIEKKRSMAMLIVVPKQVRDKKFKAHLIYADDGVLVYSEVAYEKQHRISPLITYFVR
jgi:hypothetical protein